MSSLRIVPQCRLLISLLLLAATARAAPASGAQLRLTWMDNSTDEFGFEIERRMGQTGIFTPITIVGADVETYTDSDLVDGIEYCYQVRAFNGAGNSAYSNGACGTATTSVGGGGGGASSSGCFIATAAFGSPLAPEVQALREFRDRALMSHAPGRILVAAYYRVSLPLARVIAAHEALRIATRGALWPVVWGVHGALAAPALALALGGGALVGGPLLLILRARRRKQP